VTFFAFAFLAVGMTSGPTFQEKANRFVAMPERGLGVQALAELVVLGCMYLVVAARTGGARFWLTVRWNWPVRVGLYLLIGLLMQLVFLVAERFLPFPTDTPFDTVLRRPYSLMAIAVFSVTLGPLFEELLFRGFLYPLLRKHFGVLTAIIGTALPFGLVHLAQYGYSWASGLLIFMVGVVLATVREKANSLAAGFLVHVAYNGVIIAILLAATDGFRHLEKLN
jgi:membrane protease YdiL (CAAX protease family)